MRDSRAEPLYLATDGARGTRAASMEGRMFMRGACLAALLLAIAMPPAGAQAVHGFYLQGNTGIFFQKTQSLDTTLAPPVATTDADPGAAARAGAAIGGASSLSESGSVGYGFGHGLRVEVQGIHTAGSPPGG
jgi:hypothetical protein